jgi:hypothetical protein
METTDWDKYGTGNYEKCADCMVHSGFEATAVVDAIKKPWKAVAAQLRGPKTAGDMAPEIPLEGQRPAEFVFSRHVQQAMAEMAHEPPPAASSAAAPSTAARRRLRRREVARRASGARGGAGARWAPGGRCPAAGIRTLGRGAGATCRLLGRFGFAAPQAPPPAPLTCPEAIRAADRVCFGRAARRCRTELHAEAVALG